MDNEPKQENPILNLDDEYIKEIRSKAREKVLQARHEWRQKGSWVYCKRCDFEHGFNVGVRKQLVGITEDGHPKLEDKHQVRT